MGHQGRDLVQVFRQRFGVMREIAVRIAVQLEDLAHTKGVKQIGDDQAADGVHTVDRHAEVGRADGVHIHQVEGQHAPDVTLLVTVVNDHLAQRIDRREAERLPLGQSEHLAPIFIAEELAALVEQLQRIPLLRVVARSENDASTSQLVCDGQLGGGRRGQIDVDHIEAHAHQRAHDDRFDHRPRHAGVASDDNAVLLAFRRAVADPCGVSRRKLHNRERVQPLVRTATDGAADAGYGFDECHIISV